MPESKAETPTIARIWRGRTRRADADAYEAYNYEVGIAPLIAKAAGVQTFREDRDDETWFTTMSWWRDIDAMRSFAGDDPLKPHHLPRDAEFLVELPERIEILHLRHAHGQVGTRGESDVAN